MDLDDPVLVSLRDFVAQMKDPSRNGQPVSWISFANIHGTSAGFNMCPHGNWYFLPWHRGYVHMYEQAVRDVTGNAEFAMPFWDWTSHPDFPAAFGDENVDGQPNPLFVAGRLMTTGDSIDPAVSGQAVLNSIMGDVSYEEFGSSRASGQNNTDPTWIRRPGVQGELEANPHNNIHCMIRGPFMCAATSPQDPIFQMHHCNIDRIWDAWNRAGGADSTSPLWLDMTFADNYIDPQGNLYGHAVNALLDVAPLGYTYVAEPEAPEEPQPEEPGRDLYLAYLYGAPQAVEGAFTANTAQVSDVSASPGAPANVTLETGGLALPVHTESALESFELAGVTPRRAKVFLRDIMPDAPEGTQLRVFVNSPDATVDTPTEGNPNFVTTIGFFGVGPGGTMLMEGMDEGDARSPSFAIDIPLSQAGVEAGAETMTLQLVPVPQTEGDEAAPVSVRLVELAVV